MCNKTNYKNKKHFCRYCLHCFSSAKVLTEHKKVCLKINPKQGVKLRDMSVKFNNYSKQLAVLFKVYADFESHLREIRRDNIKL